MKIILQRVTRAAVDVREEFDTQMVGQIANGYLLLVGITHEDTEADADKLVEKILKLRLFPEDGGESSFSQNIIDAGGGVLVVSQFTLYGDCKKGTRPSFTEAAKPEVAEPLYEYLVQKFVDAGIHTETGTFGAHMDVELCNDGPVTLILES